MRLLDLLSEGLSALAGRIGRSALTILGIALGVVALTSMIGLSESSSASISAEFDTRTATRIGVAGGDDVQYFDDRVGAAGLDRVEHLKGVVAASAVFPLGESGQVAVSTSPPTTDGSRTATHVSAYALLGNIRDAEGLVLVSGRWFDSGMIARADRVVIVGDLIASRLHLVGNGREMIYIGRDRFQVLGVASSIDEASPLPLSVMVPHATARMHATLDIKPPAITIRTDQGAAEVVGAQAALALDPLNPQRWTVAVPPAPEHLRSAIESQTQAQLLALAAVSIVVGAIGVSNTTLVGVLERTHEIGVRRAVGARRRDIVMQFLIENALLGGIGGLSGMLVGVLITLIAATINGWPPVVPPWVFVTGPGLGLTVGVAAGAYPAWRASQIEPVVALHG